jgi:hypothetical protein
VNPTAMLAHCEAELTRRLDRAESAVPGFLSQFIDHYPGFLRYLLRRCDSIRDRLLSDDERTAAIDNRDHANVVNHRSAIAELTDLYTTLGGK